MQPEQHHPLYLVTQASVPSKVQVWGAPIQTTPDLDVPQIYPIWGHMYPQIDHPPKCAMLSVSRIISWNDLIFHSSP